MRLFFSVLFFWVSALSTAVHAKSEVFAYFCKSADEADTFPILFEQKDGELALLGDNSAVLSMKKVAPKVFEFRFLNPAHVGYLREIEGSWKFLFSDAGIVQTSDCNDLSEELNNVLELYASSLRDGGSNDDTQTILGERRLVDTLIKENELLVRQNAEFETRLKIKTEQFDAFEENTKRALKVLGEQASAHTKQTESLGNRLNAALARAATEERKRRRLEEQLEGREQSAEDELRRYKTEFFARLREILAGQDGVTIVDDRLVFSSEVLFEPGSASLSEAGQLEIDKVANILLGMKDSIPDTLEWFIRVDGHTDNIPLSGAGEFRDNWELSQARALSVVRYMVENLWFPANRMAANGFGEFQPLNTDDTPEARAQNRRIEMTLMGR